VGLSLYSYSLIDPNLTFFNHPAWTAFRNLMVEFGYNRRQESWLVYLSIIILLFVFNYVFVLKYKKLRFTPFKIALIIGIILLFSYPFLSHDFFYYLFNAKILTFYHKNPYQQIPGDFYLDPWLRFTQWTGTSFLYGPVFLLISAVPSFLAANKLFLSFFFLKAVMVIFYLLAVYLSEKIDKQWAIVLATNPLLIIEGLVNGHNDLIALSLAVIGIYYIYKKTNLLGKLFLVLSIGIKYISFPLIFLTSSNKKINIITSTVFIGVLIILIIKSEIQPWYFMSLLILFPYIKNLLLRLNLFFVGLLLSYYPYVRFGGWEKVLYWTTSEKVALKHNIILISFICTILTAIAHRWYIKINVKEKIGSKIRRDS